jgi:tetratricopeptide (TPR) repeat protein
MFHLEAFNSLAKPARFWGVFWVDVSNPSIAHDGFVSIAKLLRLRAETVKDTLQALSSMSRRWLLVLDNADDPKVDYAAYLPSGNRGAVLMTSRIPEFRMYSTAGSEALEGLDLDHSTQLLLKAAQVPIDSWSSHTLQAHEIVQMLGSHTLALIQAGAYVAVGYCQLGQYPERYRQQRKLLLEHYPSQEQSRYQNVYATFEASMSMLGNAEDEASQDAMDLLSFFSVLHSSVLPQQVFQDAWAGAKLISRRELQMRNAAPCPTVPSHRFHRFRHLWSSNKISLPPTPSETFGNCALGEHHVASLPKFMDPSTENWNNRRLLGASALLVSLSLVARHQTNESVGLSMHPLTHAWAKDRLEKKEQEKAWISSSCLLGLSRNMSWLWRDHERQLRPHLQCLVLPNIDAVFSFESRRVILPILLQCGWLLFSMREYKRLQSLLEGFYHELGITPQNPSDEHMPIWTLASRNELRLHHIKPAIALLEHVVTIDQRMLDPRHPEGLITQYNLARAYSDDGQSEKAIPVLQHVLAIYATLTLDETQSKWQSSTQFELARALIAVGRSNEGTALLEHVVQCQEPSSPNASPEGLLTAQHALATAYNTTKETQKALPLLETIARAYAATAEKSDPDRLSSEYELARAYARNEQLEASLALLEHVVRVQKAVLEEDDYELLASQYMLAQVYNSDKQTTRGKELLQHVVNVYKVLMDESHHILLGAQHDLALAYEDDGEIGEAVGIMERVVERRKGVLEKGHKDLVRSEIALRDLRARDV